VPFACLSALAGFHPAAKHSLLTLSPPPPLLCCPHRHVKDADRDIVAALKAAGRLVDVSQLMHSYPFCWRSDTPLIYRAVPSWFVKVGAHSRLRSGWGGLDPIKGVVSASPAAVAAHPVCKPSATTMSAC
jgi:hypothetical protein